MAERRTGIGGSDVAAILGLSPYRSALDVFLNKRGDLSESPENDAMRWGSILEPVVRQEYSNATGRSVLMPSGMLRHERHQHMLANLDGFTEDGRIFEAKTARSGDGWGEPGSDEVPQAYLFQVQHYMAITAYPVADIAVLIGGSDFRIYTVEADAELHEMLFDAEADFWRRVVENQPPEPVSVADAMTLWGKFSNSRSITATADLEHEVRRLRSIKELIAGLEADAEEAKLAIMAALEDADTLVDVSGKPLVTWKATKPVERFDARALKSNYPEIYAQFTQVGEPLRRFLLK